MTQAPSYLLLSRHSVWYFRISIPESVRSLFGCCEVRRSLKTRCKREALIRSRELLGQIQLLFTEAFQGNRPNLDHLGLDQKATTNGGGWAQWVLRSCAANNGVVDDDTVKHVTAPTLTQVVDEYGRRQLLEGVSVKTVADKRSVVELLVRIVGDLPVSHIVRKDAQTFRETALKLPRRATQQPEKSLKKLVEMAEDTISVTTFNHYVKHLKTIFSYAVQEGYAGSNPFDGLQIKQRAKVNTLRSRFTDKDLKRLFSPAVYESKGQGKAYRYWLPLLGLHTGARLNELCQLYVDDVVSIDGVDCLHIQALKDGQKLKNSTSERLIPIHPKLIELGFVDYVETLKGQGVDRVFPELSLHKRHGFAANPSRWFANYRSRIGLNEGKDRKDFHSFRHTVADELKQAGVSEGLIAALLGHKSGGITFNRYGKDFNPRLLLPIVEMLSFEGIADDSP